MASGKAAVGMFPSESALGGVSSDLDRGKVAAMSCRMDREKFLRW